MWRYLQRRGRLLRAVAAKVLPEACPSDPSLTSCRHHKQGLHNLPAMDLVCCTLIIDDIVLPDGESCMAQLGGGGPQSLFGFQLVSRCLQRHTSVGLAAGVGDDLPDQCKTWLQQLGCDISGLLLGKNPTPRAWQLFEWDGKRTQVWRVPDCPAVYQQLLPAFDQLPQHFQSAANYHFGIHAAHPPVALTKAVRQAANRARGRVSLETYTHCDTPPNSQDLTTLLQLTDIFSPNQLEAASIVGSGSPQQLVQRLIAAGARTVTLRCGAEGAWVGDASSNMLIHVPAVPETQVVDVTGCGNAFCGGFLAAQHAGLDLVRSGMWGCVAGSVMAEWQGVPPADTQQLLQTAEQRYQLLQQIGSQSYELFGSQDQQLDRVTVQVASCSSGSTSTTAAHSIRPGTKRSISQQQRTSVVGPGGWQVTAVRRHVTGRMCTAANMLLSRCF